MNVQCSRLTRKGPILSTVLEWSIQSLFSSQNLTLVFQHGRCLTNAELSDIMTHINNSHLCIRVDDNTKKCYNRVFTPLQQNKVLVLIERWCVKMLAVKGPTESGRWWREGGQEIGVRSAVRWTNYGNTVLAHPSHCRDQQKDGNIRQISTLVWVLKVLCDKSFW